jgi:hypothetical protein
MKLKQVSKELGKVLISTIILAGVITYIVGPQGCSDPYYFCTEEPDLFISVLPFTLFYSVVADYMNIKLQQKYSKSIALTAALILLAFLTVVTISLGEKGGSDSQKKMTCEAATALLCDQNTQFKLNQLPDQCQEIEEESFNQTIICG